MEIKINLERIFYALNKAFDALSLMHNYILGIKFYHLFCVETNI